MTLIIETDVHAHRISDARKTVVKTDSKHLKKGAGITEDRTKPARASTGWRQVPAGRFRVNMSAFLKIDTCQNCCQPRPWEWVPAVFIRGKPLAGTGVWRSELIDGQCLHCRAKEVLRIQQERRTLARRAALIRLLGGEKPFREFTFVNFAVTPSNQRALECCQKFNPAIENLYLWGACGVGKTHLSSAIIRTCFDETLSVARVQTAQLSRRVRMKDPPRNRPRSTS
jgi:chromosomal replication initiation ATPase DnaA